MNCDFTLKSKTSVAVSGMLLSGMLDNSDASGQNASVDMAVFER